MSHPPRDLTLAWINTLPEAEVAADMRLPHESVRAAYAWHDAEFKREYGCWPSECFMPEPRIEGLEVTYL